MRNHSTLPKVLKFKFIKKSGKETDYQLKLSSKLLENRILNFIEYFLDTTPTKFGKFTPGSNIPIIKYNGIPKNIKYAYLGAWNFKDEIFKKEKKFIKNGGKFITHVPYPKII